MNKKLSHKKVIELLAKKAKLPVPFVKEAVTYVNCSAHTLLEDPQIGAGTPAKLKDWFLGLAAHYKALKLLLPSSE